LQGGKNGWRPLAEGEDPVVALTYRATVDVPARFRNSKAVGAVFGLTPSKYQSGQINRTGAISKCGGRDDAGDALRSGSDHAGASSKVVMAQGLGDEHADSEEKREPASDIDSVMAG
jgi:Transposase IS116/IS110/IS902 family